NTTKWTASGAWRSASSPPPETTTKAGACSSSWACRSAPRKPLKGTTIGQEVDDRQIAAPAAVQGASTQPLQDLRAAARLLPQVRDVPHLPAGSRPQRPRHRHRLDAAWRDDGRPGAPGEPRRRGSLLRVVRQDHVTYRTSTDPGAAGRSGYDRRRNQCGHRSGTEGRALPDAESGD